MLYVTVSGFSSHSLLNLHWREKKKYIAYSLLNLVWSHLQQAGCLFLWTDSSLANCVKFEDAVLCVLSTLILAVSFSKLTYDPQHSCSPRKRCSWEKHQSMSRAGSTAKEPRTVGFRFLTRLQCDKISGCPCQRQLRLFGFAWPGTQTREGPRQTHMRRAALWLEVTIATVLSLSPCSTPTPSQDTFPQWRRGQRVVAVQSLNHVWLFATLWTEAHKPSPSFTISWSFLKFMSIESVTLSSCLILCHPLLLPSIFPRIRVFSSELALLNRWPKYWSFSFSISPSSK